jgi:hypothetical protein
MEYDLADNALYFSDEQSFNGDIETPPSDMVVDSDEFLLNGTETEKDDESVAVIHPDENLPRADECMWKPIIIAASMQPTYSCPRSCYERDCSDPSCRTTSNHRRCCTYLAHRKLVQLTSKTSWADF